MSWDALLLDDRGHVEHEVNFTHNCNRMIRAAVDAIGRSLRWYSDFDGLSGADGAAFLHDIVIELERDPDRYDAMNPENGWGSRESLVPVLRAMRDAVPEWPTEWSISG